MNVLNPKPIASLSQLVDGSRKLSMEDTLAAILYNFQTMWDTFIQVKGSFEPFMDLYLRRWLHSYVSSSVLSSFSREKVLTADL